MGAPAAALELGGGPGAGLPYSQPSPPLPAPRPSVAPLLPTPTQGRISPPARDCASLQADSGRESGCSNSISGGNQMYPIPDSSYWRFTCCPQRSGEHPHPSPASDAAPSPGESECSTTRVPRGPRSATGWTNCGEAEKNTSLATCGLRTASDSAGSFGVCIVCFRVFCLASTSAVLISRSECL